MKKICLLITMSFSILFAIAQHVPQGMKYQAVARNLSGAILANQEVALKINLVTQNGTTPVIYYSEVHTVVTNQLGLFSLTIGEGKIETGSFSKIPWSTEDIWMQVAIKDKDKSSFAIISNSKLLAVPYAFHAETASKLVESSIKEGASVSASATLTTPLSTGIPAAVWTLKGNTYSNPMYDHLGTGDSVDLIIVSNNKERVRIAGNGDMGVKQNVRLNTAGGTTDIKGATNMQSTLDVTGAAHLKSTLMVDSILTVTNMTQSASPGTGALVVYGGAGIGGNVNIAGISNISNTTASTNTTSGALIVAGGEGIAGNLNVAGITNISNNTASTNTITGAVVVTGGVGIGGNLNVAGASSFGSVTTTTLTSKSLNVTDDNASFLATINNTNVTDGDGLKIKLGRIHPLWNGTAYENVAADNFSPVYNAFAPQVALVGSWLSTGNVTISASDVLSLLKSTGTFLGGALCQLTNALSPLLNQKIGLPIDISTPLNTGMGLPLDISTPINTGIGLPVDVSTPINKGIGLPFAISAPINSGIGLPFDLTSPINTALKLPIVLGPFSTPQVNMPAVVMPDVVLPGLSTSDISFTVLSHKFDLGSLHVTDPITIFPSATLFPASTLLPATTIFPQTTVVPTFPALSIPAIPTLIVPAIPGFSIPALPAFSIPAIPAFSIPAIPQINCGGLPQIGAPNILTSNVNNSLTNQNEFVKFVDKDDRTLGVIRAQSIGDFKNYYLSNDYLFHLVGAVGGIDIGKGLLSLASEFNTLAHLYNKLGVEYVSGNGDYAEWMQRKSFSETITAGDIVGVIGGRISKNLAGAEQIMAVSTQPIVSANMPNATIVNLGNTIAFMGQIPVKIIGFVSTGDFIIAKGNVPGYGVAVNPAMMTTEDFRLIVGRAWETINADGPKLVNTLVGVQNNDFLKIIQKYQQKVTNAETRVSTAEDRLNAIEKKLNMYPSGINKSRKK